MVNETMITVPRRLLVDLEKLLTRHQQGGRYDVYADPLISQLREVLDAPRAVPNTLLMPALCSPCVEGEHERCGIPIGPRRTCCCGVSLNERS